MSQDPETKTLSTKKVALNFIAALVSVVSFLWIGAEYFQGFLLGLNGFNVPVPRDSYFQCLWLFFGGLAGLYLANALGELTSTGLVRKFIRDLASIPEPQWILFFSLMAALSPLLVHTLVINGYWVTDDEEAYQFSARLLAQGKLFIESYPEKEFFDRQFVVNNGRMFTQYFLGWPALMVPGVWLRQDWLINPILSGVTVYPFFHVIKHYTSSGGARFATFFYLLSPLLLIGAATKHSHTSCMLFLWLMLWSWIQWQKSGRKGWLALVSLCFSIAFFIRPTSTMGIGAPVLLVAAISTLRKDHFSTLTRLAFLAAPCLVLGAAFLCVNKAQNGEYLKVAYQSYEEWHWSEDRLFATSSDQRPASVGPAQGGDLNRGIATSGIALHRINSDLFGWPMSLIFVVAASFFLRNKMIWAMVPCYLGFHWFITNVGVGVYAPMHYIELTIPFLILTAQGMHLLSAKCRESTDVRFSGLGLAPYLYATACMVLTILVYYPIKFVSIERLTSDIGHPLAYVKEHGIRNALVFSPTPFTRNCSSLPVIASAYFMPINSPALDDDILWVNHITYRRDMEFASRFPQREAYLMYWTEGCQLGIARLRDLAPERVSDNPVVNPRFLSTQQVSPGS